MRGEACLTDLQQGQYHHVFSGGRRWGLGLGRAAAMVWQLAVGMGGLPGLEGLHTEGAGGGVWDKTGVAGRPGPWSLEASVPRGPGWPGVLEAPRIREGHVKGPERPQGYATSPEAEWGGGRATRSCLLGPRD